MTAAASASLAAAWNSPSACITLARFSRSASACFAMARCISWGRSTCFTSTRATLIPQPEDDRPFVFLDDVDRAQQIEYENPASIHYSGDLFHGLAFLCPFFA